VYLHYYLASLLHTSGSCCDIRQCRSLACSWR